MKQLLRKLAQYLACPIAGALACASLVLAQPADLSRAVELLKSDVFLDREKGSQQLIAAGRDAIPHLEKVAIGEELETTARALSILESLALDGVDVVTREEARGALQRLGEMKSPRVADRATRTLAEIQKVRRTRAVAHLEKLGAKFEERQTLVGPGFVPVDYVLEVGTGWTGTADDLQDLERIDDLAAISLVGDQVTDEWLKHVGKAQSLKTITLKRTKVTAEGLSHLAKLEKLEVLDVLYSPLENSATQPLSQMPQLALIRLFGTKITKAAAAKLANDLPGAKVDLRQGGFFGVGVQPHPLGCIISNVQPGTAAAKKGIEVGDVILSFAGKRVGNFDELTAVIADFKPGDEVEVELYRGIERENVKIKLGEWD